jgi:hypothetical protein
MSILLNGCKPSERLANILVLVINKPHVSVQLDAWNQDDTCLPVSLQTHLRSAVTFAYPGGSSAAVLLRLYSSISTIMALAYLLLGDYSERNFWNSKGEMFELSDVNT